MKRLSLLVMWLAGSMAAIGVAWAGVSAVDDQVIDPASAVNLQASTDDTPSSTTTVDSAVPTLPSTSTTLLSGAADASTNQASTTSGQPANPPANPTATTQTFTLIGGTTEISFSSTGVTVLWATPNPGFTVEIESEATGVGVEFEADHHQSSIEAWWSGGPQHESTEEPEEPDEPDESAEPED